MNNFRMTYYCTDEGRVGQTFQMTDDTIVDFDYVFFILLLFVALEI